MGNENFVEKVSVNINSSTLSTIDLLVDNGYYSNRSDFINQALREALRGHQTTVDRIVERNEKKCGDADLPFRSQGKISNYSHGRSRDQGSRLGGIDFEIKNTVR